MPRDAAHRLPAYLLLLPLIAACSGPRPPPVPLTSLPLPEPARPALDVVELSVDEAARRLAAGDLTSRALVEAYRARIATVDRAGPRLNSIIELNANAVAEAETLDAERRAGRLRGPLHGMPVLIKDNVDVAGMVNSAGSLALATHRPRADAFLVRRLRDAGVVILGKTNLSEWANFRSSRSTSGWSSRGGQTLNPYALDRNPCGSSSGTGAAIAASLAVVGVGTETNGSIICPASVNGLVGLKPTVGLISRTGIIPISASQDTAGPIGRSVRDVALLLGAMAGADPQDTASHGSRVAVNADYAAGLTPENASRGLQGRRIGVLRQAGGFDSQVDAVFERALEALRTGGATLLDVQVEGWRAWRDPELDVLLYEFKDGLNRYLTESRAPVASLEQLIRWNEVNAARVMPFFGQELFEMAQAKGPLSDAAYRNARETARRRARAAIDGPLARERLDALVAPSTGPAWITDPVLGDHFIGAGYDVAAVAGTPSITIPAGEIAGLPVGVTFMAGAWREAELLAIGHAFEQATRARRPPTYAQSLTPGRAGPATPP